MSAVAPAHPAASPSSWWWQDGSLIDSNGDPVAHGYANMLSVGEHRILCEYNVSGFRFRCRGTTEGGEVFIVTPLAKWGSSYAVHCGDVHYRVVLNKSTKQWQVHNERGLVASISSASKNVERIPVILGEAAETTPDEHFVFACFAALLLSGMRLADVDDALAVDA